MVCSGCSAWGAAAVRSRRKGAAQRALCSLCCCTADKEYVYSKDPEWRRLFDMLLPISKWIQSGERPRWLSCPSCARSAPPFPASLPHCWGCTQAIYFAGSLCPVGSPSGSVHCTGKGTQPILMPSASTINWSCKLDASTLKTSTHAVCTYVVG